LADGVDDLFPPFNDGQFDRIGKVEILVHINDLYKSRGLCQFSFVVHAGDRIKPSSIIIEAEIFRYGFNGYGRG